MPNQRMLEGFAEYVEPEPSGQGNQRVIGTPPGTRLMRLERLPHGWRAWLATRDFVYGTYLELFDDGRVLNCTTRADEGDEYFWVRGQDIRRQPDG